MGKKFFFLFMFVVSELFAAKNNLDTEISPRDSVLALLDSTRMCQDIFGQDASKWDNCIDNYDNLLFTTMVKGKENGFAWYFDSVGNEIELQRFELRINGKLKKAVDFNKDGRIRSTETCNSKIECSSIFYNGQDAPFTGRDSIFHGDTLFSSSYYKNGIKEGYEYTYYPSGQIKFEQHYKKGTLEGKETCYRQDGQIWYESFYKNGNREGITKEYYDDGTKEEHGSIHWVIPYSKDKREGIVKGYYPNGQIWITQVFKKGKQEGKQIEYSQKTGKIISTATFKGDEIVGDKQCSDGRFGSNELDCTPLDE